MVPWGLRVHTQTASRSIQSFLRGWHDPATDRHIHRPHCMCSSRPHPMLCNVMRHKSYFAAPSPARRSILMSGVIYAHFHAVLLISSLKGSWSKLFAITVLSSFDSIFNLLQITLVASSNVNEVEDIDLWRVWALGSMVLLCKKSPFCRRRQAHLIHG